VSMPPPTLSCRRHFVFGLSVTECVRADHKHQKSVNMIYYKPLAGISPYL